MGEVRHNDAQVSVIISTRNVSSKYGIWWIDDLVGAIETDQGEFEA